MLQSDFHLKVLSDLQNYYQTSVAFAEALGITRMTLIAWRDVPKKIKVKNQDKIDWLWCQYIFLPNVSSASEIVKGIELADFLLEPAVMNKTLRKMAAGSLEIETGTKEADFNVIVLDNAVPNNFHATSVAEVQNIYHITQEIVQNFEVKIILQQIKDWHKVLMRGLINNAGEFANKQRVLPNADTQLTHPDDIVEELENWVKAYGDIQNLTDIAKAHYHFEIIHPFSDGNGHLGRLIIFAQCLQIGIKPPVINNNNKRPLHK